MPPVRSPAPDPVTRAPVPLDACALARAIDVIGDAWTLLILREALCGVERFDAMQADLGIPRSVLAARLARMVEQGLLERRTYRDPGRRGRPAYRLTEKGRGLVPALAALRQWSRTHLAHGPSLLSLVDHDGVCVETRLVRADGQAVEDLTAIRARAGPPVG
ncbi:MAG: helix-turn-helix transcriptional regulator [Methylobacteriaceae bacterium]|nr:helix-turn-helix transcriptional regulator [Methylobacteriaceae bacterium]